MLSLLTMAATALLAAGPSSFTVAMTIRDGSRVIATPTLTVKAGQTATLETKTYAVRVTARALEEAPTHAQVASEIALPRGGKLQVVASPARFVEYGKPTDVPAAPGGTVSVTFRVDPAR